MKYTRKNVKFEFLSIFDIESGQILEMVTLIFNFAILGTFMYMMSKNKY